MIELKGIEFRSVDNRLMALKLVQLGLSGAAMFGPDREVLQPSEVLRKKAILVERGSFRPPTVVNIDMLEAALAKFEADPAVAEREVLTLTELTMANLRAGGDVVDRRDFLARADLLAACGHDRADLRLPRLPPARRLPGLAHRRPDRDRHGRARACSTCSTRRTTPTSPAASWRASAGCSRTTCGSSSTRCCATDDVVTVDTVDGRRRAAAAVRLPGPARQLRRPGQLQAGLPADPQPRRAQADPDGRHDLGVDGPARGRAS